jgi:hypothetical protein
MNTTEIKNKLHQIIDESDDELTNILMEAAVEYKSNADVEIPQEWIDEANDIDQKVERGEMKTHSLENHLNTINALMKSKINVV